MKLLEIDYMHSFIKKDTEPIHNDAPGIRLPSSLSVRLAPVLPSERSTPGLKPQLDSVNDPGYLKSIW